MKRYVTGVSAFVALTLLLLACTTQERDASYPSPDVQPEPSSTSESGHTTGGETGEASVEPKLVSLTTRLIADDARFLLVAQQTLVARCMEERGFLYIVPQIPEDPFDHPQARWSTVVPELASQKGYGLYDARFAEASLSDEGSSEQAEGDTPGFEGDVPPGEDTGDPQGDYLNTLSPERQQEWMAALTGTEENAIVVSGAGEGGGDAFIFTDGCVAEVEDTLYGDLVALLQSDLLIQSLRSEQGERIDTDQRFAQAQDAWFRCMRREGFDLEDFGGGYDLAQAAYEEMPLEKARGFEIEVAMIDAACVEESGVNRIYRKLLAEADEYLETEHAGVLLGLRELQEQAVQRAKELLADS
jgi:hypothetical protein